MSFPSIPKNRVHESLNRAFNHKRFVFWYDPEGEWLQEFENFKSISIEKRVVNKNEFSLKVEISRSPLQKQFLLYFNTARPNDQDNWLLDILLSGFEFKADRASLDLQDVNLSLEFKPLAKEHKSFFRSKTRTQKLKELLKPDDDDVDIRLKMLAILAKQPPSIDRILLSCLIQKEPESFKNNDIVKELFGSYNLSEFFWSRITIKFGYESSDPNLLDFVIELFKSNSFLFDKSKLETSAKIFLSDWKDSIQSNYGFIEWSNYVADLLKIDENLNDQEYNIEIGEDDSFESIELFNIHRLLKLFINKTNRKEISNSIKERKTSFWFNKHEHGYLAIEYAICLADLIENAELELNSFDEGLQRYCNNWWKLDEAYRCFIFHSLSYGQSGLFKNLKEWVENNYVNNVLLNINNKFSDQILGLKKWESRYLPLQNNFFNKYLEKSLSTNKSKRFFVVISDALRYEAARDFTNRLNVTSGKVWEANIDAMLGVLPSYTQLGMASLLPGEKLKIDLESPNIPVTVDGFSATGKDNREKILNKYINGRAKVFNSEDFLTLSTNKKGAEIIRVYNLIVIYHNRIDRIGDKLESETETCTAVENAFDDLRKIIRKISSLNGNNVLITTDHGFLFQQDAVDDLDRSNFPKANQLKIKKRRFLLGNGIETNPGQKIFTSDQLSIEGNWEAAFPLGLDRFPLSGSGNRFVHGGISLQEVVIPVIKLKRIPKICKEFIKAEILNLPNKITTPRLKFSLYQKDIYNEILFMPLKLKISILAKSDETLLTEPKIILLNSTEDEPRNREQQINMELSNLSEGYNNQWLELRIEHLQDNISSPIIYLKEEFKLLQPFGNDFEDF